MTLTSTRVLIEDAVARSRAVPAFNVITLDQAEAVVAGADDARVPALIQVSQNSIRFHGDGRGNEGFQPLLAACRELAASTQVGIGIHVDHLEDADLARDVLAHAEDLGFGSIMFDRAALPYSENVALTAEIVRVAHHRGMWVEGELGEVGGKDGAHAPGVRTDPAEARRFVADTGVDGLAVAVGSSHAMTDRSARLDLELIRKLAAAVDVPLVLHGSSGVGDGMLSDAVSAGIRKVNIGTALSIAGSTRLREELATRPDAMDPRSYLRGTRSATRDLVAHLASVVG